MSRPPGGVIGPGWFLWLGQRDSNPQEASWRALRPCLRVGDRSAGASHAVANLCPLSRPQILGGFDAVRAIVMPFQARRDVGLHGRPSSAGREYRKHTHIDRKTDQRARSHQQF